MFNLEKSAGELYEHAKSMSLMRLANTPSSVQLLQAKQYDDSRRYNALATYVTDMRANSSTLGRWRESRRSMVWQTRR